MPERRQTYKTRLNWVWNPSVNKTNCLLSVVQRGIDKLLLTKGLVSAAVPKLTLSKTL